MKRDLDPDREGTADLRGQAGAPETDVTPTMIEAGLEILMDYDPEADPAREFVRKMASAILASRPPRP